MVLVQSPTTTTAINSTTNNDYLSFPTDMSGPNPSAVGVSPQISSAPYFDSHGFGVCQLTTVGTSDATIRTLVLIPISASPYRKVLIAKIFFRQIFGYVDSPSISINDLVSTVSLYFDMSTATAEWEAEAAAIAIRDSIFFVDNISDVGFLTSKGKSVTINDLDNHPRDLSYFTFRSSLNPHTVYFRAPNTVHQF